MKTPSRKAQAIAAGLLLCSGALYSFLGRWEGADELTVYADRLAKGIPTVCRGLTYHVTNTPIIVGDVWTKEQCEREEKRAIEVVQWQLLECFTLPPPQRVFDAATSHAWNFGAPKTCGSEAMKAWNLGAWSIGCRRMQISDGGKLVWVYSDGKFVRGLANRRAAERALCEGRS